METLIFKKYNMKINLNKITAVIGPESSGKTTIFKLLANKINNESVYLDKKRLNDYEFDFLKKNVMTIFDFESFLTDYVKDELSFYLKKFNYNEKEISSRVSLVTHYFHIEDLIDYKIAFLNTQEKCFIKILSFLIVNPDILGIDNLFSYLNNDQVKLIIDYVKDYNISLIYTSTNPEYLLYSDEVVVINNFKLVKSGETKKVLKDKILKDLKLPMPFIIEINEYLKYYELVDKDFETINECVGALWK